MSLFYNDVEFKAEDAMVSLFTAPVIANLGGLTRVVRGLESDDLETSHIAVIAERFQNSGLPQSGNWEKCVMRVKVVTDTSETVPNGFATRRDLHRQRVGVARDLFMAADLDTQLTSAVADFTVMGFDFGELHQRIVGRSWITEWQVILGSVCCVDV